MQKACENIDAAWGAVWDFEILRNPGCVHGEGVHENLFFLFNGSEHLAEFNDKLLAPHFSVTFHRKVETCLAKESLRALKASRLMNNGELSSTLIANRFHSTPTFHPFQSQQQVNFAERRFQWNFLSLLSVPPNTSSFSTSNKKTR